MYVKHLFYIFIVALITLGGSCCKKDEQAPPVPILPPETQTGANTFGCLLEGNVWLPKGAGLLQTLKIEYYNGSIIIGANKGSTDERVNLNVTGIYSDTAFIINNKNSQFFYYRVSSTFYILDNIHTGWFNLKKLDTINHIMAGTFWFDATDTVSKKVVQIRDGRFDVKY